MSLTIGYHGDTDSPSQNESYINWKSGQAQVIVATIAFGRLPSERINLSPFTKDFRGGGHTTSDKSDIRQSVSSLEHDFVGTTVQTLSHFSC